jgi:hypothetical protein
MSINSNKEVAPSIKAVPLQYKQKFKDGGVSKNTITFDRIEDMMTICLSTFVHDYVHDYNLGSMHARVVKGNINRVDPDIPSIFETLGINIGNTIFKVIAYPIGGHRDISMYKDEQFEDVDTSDTNKLNFYNYLNNNEESIQDLRGGATILQQPTAFLNKSSPFNDGSTSTSSSSVYTGEKSTLIDDKLKPIYLEPTIDDKSTLVDIPVSQTDKEITQVDEELMPVAEGITEEIDIITKPVSFIDVTDVLFIPTNINSLNIEEVVNTFERNADFLSFHSSLNTYVVTYLGYDINKEEEYNNIGNDKNEVANNAIKASLRYIINDLKEEDKSLFCNFYGDIFSLLLDSYEIISEKKLENKESPFDILNSPEILYQFIIFYVSYISVESYDKFKAIITNMKGGDGDGEEIEMSEVDASSSDASATKVESISSILPSQQTEIIEIPEYVYITHNNLLTTITRGMFIKLGIWKRIFFSDTPIEEITPEDYKFGPEEINKITYDKLVELFPIKNIITSEDTTTEIIGHPNNELLILEILILKRLLVEMSPSKTLTFGANIDDDLKNYMDAFYLYNYDIKEFPKDNISKDIIPDVVNNPNFTGPDAEKQEQEEEELFAMCDDNCIDSDMEHSAISGKMEGGGQCIGKPGEKCSDAPTEKKNDETINRIDFQRIAEEDENKEKANFEVTSSEVHKELDEAKENLEELISRSSDIIPEQASILPLVEEVNTQVLNPDEDIIEQPRPPPIPILFNKLKKMYQNNMLTIKQLHNSKIQSISYNGETIDNLFKLLELNQTLMHNKGSTVNLPAPKYKFVINNAANVGSNLNGSRMFIPKKFVEPIKTTVDEIKKEVFDGDTLNGEKLTEYTKNMETELENKYKELESKYEIEIKELETKKRHKIITIKEYNRLSEQKFEKKKFERSQIAPLENKLFLLEVLKENPEFYNDFSKNYAEWFKDSQPMFGLYRSLQRGIFCPTSSMMDAMDNCSLKYEATEPKEVGTTYSEIIYKDSVSEISFGGVVLNYNQQVNGEQQLTAKIYYTLDCSNMGGCVGPDKMIINTIPIQVSESHNLKARVAYQGVVKMIKEIYDFTDSSETFEGVNYIKEMWKRTQYQYDQGGFNMLLSATALKTMGDYLQECQACFKWGGYINNYNDFPIDLTRQRQFEMVKDKLIYRSVSKGGAIVPYNKETGDGLRLGIQGDRPSGFRSIYMLLNGEGDVNDQAITGYMFTSSNQNPSRTLLVSRNSANMREPNSNGLKGNVIYVTRELQVPDRDTLLKSLEFLNVKDKNRKIYGNIVTPEIEVTTIVGSQNVTDKLLSNPMTKIQPLKNSAYEELLDYTNDTFKPTQPEVKVENIKTDIEEAREQRKNKLKQTKGMDPETKAQEKARIKAEKIEAEHAEKAAKEAKRKRISEEKAKLNTDINEAKRAINNLRDDLTSKQKTAKKIYDIPFAFLNDPEKQSAIQSLEIPEEIYKFIYDQSQENVRIEKLEEEQKRLDNEEKLRKDQEKAAYEASPEGIIEREEKQRKIIEKAAEEDDKIAKKQAEEESAITEKEQRIQELPNLIAIKETELEEAKELKGKGSQIKKRELQEQLKTLKEEFSRLTRRRGGTLSNKKKQKHKYKITKREYKKVNKLTKRNKKIKIPKKTRKYI